MDIETQFVPTPEIIKRGVWFFWKNYCVRPQELFLTTIFLCLLVGIGLVEGAKSSKGFIIVNLYSLFFLCLWIVRFRIYFLPLKKKMNSYRQLAGSSVKLQLTDSIMVLASGQMRSEFQWVELKRMIKSDKFLLLCWNGLNFTIIPVIQLSQESVSIIQQKATEQVLAPPIMREVALERARVGNAILRAACLWVLPMILVPSALFLFIIFRLQNGSRVSIQTPPGKFWVDVIGLESRPNYFMERVRVRGTGDMKVSLGIGSPREAGQSIQVYADGVNATCEMLLNLNTSTNTIWHSELGGSVLDTAFPDPLAVSAVETNLSGPYKRGYSVTLLNIGGKKSRLQSSEP